MKKFKIIFIISFSPKYQFLEDPNDTTGMVHYWKNPKGENIGVYNKDWGNKIIDQLQQLNPKLDYEVWRPDIRADKTYVFEFPNGVKSYSFPSQHVTGWQGIKQRKEEFSHSIIDHLTLCIKNNEKLVIILPFVCSMFFAKTMALFNDRIPIIVLHLLNIQILFADFQTLKPLSLIHRLVRSLQTERLLKQIKYFTVPHCEGKEILRNKYKFKLSFYHPGIDTKNLLKPITKAMAKRMLGISEASIFILVSSRLVSEKQIDKLIEVLSKLKKYNWVLHITGHGEKAYTALINQLVFENDLINRVKFCGYVSDEVLMQNYCASDLYCITSRMEGGPISALLAIWYGVPVFSTNTGAIAEFLDRTKSGLIVGTTNYFEWETVLEQFFEGKKVNKPPLIEFLDIFSTDKNTNRLNRMIMESASEY